MIILIVIESEEEVDTIIEVILEVVIQKTLEEVIEIMTLEVVEAVEAVEALEVVIEVEIMTEEEVLLKEDGEIIVIMITNNLLIIGELVIKHKKLIFNQVMIPGVEN